MQYARHSSAQEELALLQGVYGAALERGLKAPVTEAEIVDAVRRAGGTRPEAMVVAQCLLPPWPKWLRVLAIHRPARTPVQVLPAPASVLQEEDLTRVFGPNWLSLLGFFRFLDGLDEATWRAYMKSRSILNEIVAATGALADADATPGRKVATELTRYGVYAMPASLVNTIVEVVGRIELDGLPGKDRQRREAEQAAESWFRFFGLTPTDHHERSANDGQADD